MAGFVISNDGDDVSAYNLLGEKAFVQAIGDIIKRDNALAETY